MTILPTSPNYDIRTKTSTTRPPSLTVHPIILKKATLTQKIVFSGIAASIGVIVTNPIDVVKVRLQSQRLAFHARASEAAQYRGMLHAFVKISRQEGISGLWKGVGVAVLRSSTYGGIRLGSYGPLRDQVNCSYQKYIQSKSTGVDSSTQSGILVKVIAAIISGSTSAFLTNPLELLKVRQQGASTERLSIVATLTKVAQERGSYLALWDGTSASMLRSAVLTIAQAGSYDHIKHLLLGYGLPDSLFTHVSSSTMAGLITTTLISPFDVIKTRLMQHKGSMYSSVFDCVYKTWSQEGAFGLMKGWVPNYVRQGPQTLIIWVVYEQLCKWLHVTSL